MTTHNRHLVEVLKKELEFLEKDGVRRSARTAGRSLLNSLNRTGPTEELEATLSLCLKAEIRRLTDARLQITGDGKHQNMTPREKFITHN